MSFVQPNVSHVFTNLLQYFLWFQLFYAIWQFLRTAKYCRLPYVLFSSLWNGLDSWFKARKIILLKDIPLDPIVNALDVLDGVTMEKLGNDDGAHNYKVTFKNYDTIYVTDRVRGSHMVLLHTFIIRYKVKFGMADDLLWPNGHLIRKVGFLHAMDHVMHGGGYEVMLAVSCFFDYSSIEVLNQNFLRFSSIWPLILQARHFDFWSAVGSVIVIFLDVFSFQANKVWRSTQYWICRIVKTSISVLCTTRESKLFWYTFMSTISNGFICSNFMTGESSLKVLKLCPMHSNIRLNLKKHRIQQLIHLECVPGPWQNKNNYFKMHHVWYRIHFQNGFTNNSFSVKITLQAPPQHATMNLDSTQEEEGRTNPNFLHKEDATMNLDSTQAEEGRTNPNFLHKEDATMNLDSTQEEEGWTNPNFLHKEEGWTREDMAYFFSVLSICNETKVGPLTNLNGNNGSCCDLSMLISAVKLRKIFICEFVQNEIIYVS
ncbi:unnamed protein product [Sphagnum troendelagicum]|uniref:Uncharacterized protein n=1 Tax=Sphagnum troendelagicum TaxID=128251 RepID=A0ABP0TAA8_9BRYO